MATPSDASTTLDPHPMAGETEFLHEEGPVVVAPAPAPNHAAQGVAYALIAYSTWGTAIPIYMWGMSNRWAAATAIELLLHRIAWGLAAMALLLTVRRRWPSLVGIVRSWSSFRVLIATTVLIAINWFTFTWSVVNGAAAEVALGYYINPLVSIAMGMVFLGERMRPVQWWCIGIAIAGVALQAVAIGRLPYLALIVAGSFGTYGLLRKRAKADADVGLTVEMGLTFPIAMAGIAWMMAADRAVFLADQTPGWVSAMFALGGPLTIIPLIAFTAGARRLRLSTMGFLQYIAPTGQFVLSFLVFGETMSPLRLASFCLIWLSLAIFSVESVAAARRARAARRAAADPTD